MRTRFAGPSLLFVGAFTLSVALPACGKKDAAAEGGAAPASGDAAAASGDAAAPAAAGSVNADPKVLADFRKVLDGFGECKLTGKAFDPDESLPESLRLEGWDAGDPEGCDEAWTAYDEFVRPQVADEAKAAIFRDVALASLDHPKAPSRYMVVMSMLDLPKSLEVGPAHIAHIGGALAKETDGNVASVLGEYVGNIELANEAQAAAIGEIMKSTANEAFVDGFMGSWGCQEGACTGVVRAWAENPNPAIRNVAFNDLVNLDESVLSDAALCDELAKSLAHEDAALVGEAAARIFETGEPCDPKADAVLAQLDARKGKVDELGLVFLPVWDSGRDFEGEQKAKVLEAAKAIVAAKPDDQDLMAAAQDCVSAYSG